ncbi:unnamed protein product [Boreogadus saida]
MMPLAPWPVMDRYAHSSHGSSQPGGEEEEKKEEEEEEEEEANASGRGGFRGSEYQWPGVRGANTQGADHWEEHWEEHWEDQATGLQGQAHTGLITLTFLPGGDNTDWLGEIRALARGGGANTVQHAPSSSSKTNEEEPTSSPLTILIGSEKSERWLGEEGRPTPFSTHPPLPPKTNEEEPTSSPLLWSPGPPVVEMPSGTGSSACPSVAAPQPDGNTLRISTPTL